MKNLIKKILREQVEKDLDETPKVEDKAMYRIRVVLELMKRYGKKWDGYLDAITKDKKEPYGYSGMRDNLNNLLKIVGGSKEAWYGGDFEKTYWFSKVFQINGGENRNFKEGEIQLIELPQYEMEASYREEQIDNRTGWGTIIAVKSEDEAIDIYANDIGGYLEDSESHDMDYGEKYCL